MAEGQLRDYRSRLGTEFAQAEYLRELSGLRDRLQQGLAGRTSEGEPCVAEVVEQIGKLRAVNKVEGVAKWPVQRATHHAEQPVTVRIRERMAGEVSESEEGTPSPLGHTNRQDKLRKQQASINQHS